MFPRGKRVSRADFPKLSNSRTRAFSPHFSATLAQSPQGVAVVVSKKVEKTSVGRHRLKRRVSEIVRTLASLPMPGILIFAKTGASRLVGPELKEEIQKLLS